MAGSKQLFRQHHVTRAVKGAVAAGMSNPTVQVRLTDGAATITIAGGKKAAPQRAPSRPSRTGK